MGRKNQRGTFGKGWRTKDADIFNPENYGIPQRKSILDEIEDSPESRKSEKRRSLQERISVGKTPTVKKRVTNAGEYPENAIIISIGPTSGGKTKYLNTMFNGNDIYTYTKLKKYYAEKGEKKSRQCYIQQVENEALNAQGRKVVIDAPFLDSGFRKRIYKIAQKSGRPVFIINHILRYEECLKRIEEKYEKRGEDPRTAYYKNESIKKLQKSYEEFLGVIPTLEAELENCGMMLPEYESQITDIVHVQKQKINASNSDSGR